MKAQAETTHLLAAPLRLSSHAWPAGTAPTVSICCITFNHRAFISECIDGFLMQETTFPVEILVHDDASNDGTAAIVAEYQKTYPGLIKATLRAENQYSQGKSPGRYLRSIAQGPYIAYCEGDDAWICPSKLQTQYEYLQRFPQAIMAAHDAKVIGRASLDMLTETASPPRIEYVAGTEIIEGRYLRMLSVFHRNDRRALAQCKPRRIVNGDRYLFAMLSVYGDTVLSSEKMAIYRIHSGGTWSGATRHGRYENVIRSRIAIARDIRPSHCPFACRDLYERSTAIARACGQSDEYATAIRYLGFSLLSFCLSFRTLSAHPKHWHRMLVVQIRTIWATARVASGIVRRVMKLRRLQS